MTADSTLALFLRYRLDAAGFAALALAACYFCRSLVRRRQADLEFSPATCALVALLTPRGTVTLFLHWSPPAPGVPHGLLRVRVCDTGIGIAAEKCRTLFQMFVQADASTTRRFGGTGLGLAICHRLVALMGGEIAVTSEPGHGSEFSFNLPATPVSLPAEISPGDQPTGAVLAYRPRILVVDDMETNRFLLEVFLHRHGFAPELAAGGEEAIRLASAHRYDAILMDLHMPDLDGFTATQRIRAAEPPGQRTPIIALTASITKGTREKCLAGRYG